MRPPGFLMDGELLRAYDDNANNQAIHIIQQSATLYKIELLLRPNYVLTAKGSAHSSDVQWELNVNSEFQKWDFEVMATLLP